MEEAMRKSVVALVYARRAPGKRYVLVWSAQANTSSAAVALKAGHTEFFDSREGCLRRGWGPHCRPGWTWYCGPRGYCRCVRCWTRAQL